MVDPGSGLVQREAVDIASLFVKPPLVKQKLSKSRAFNPLQNCLGIIASVSTFTRSTGATIPFNFVNACINFSSVLLNSQLLRLQSSNHVHPRSVFDRSCRCHCRRYEMRSASAALAAFEVPVGCGSAALSRLQYIRVHRKAHTAACFAPFETCLDENFVKPFFSA